MFEEQQTILTNLTSLPVPNPNPNPNPMLSYSALISEPTNRPQGTDPYFSSNPFPHDGFQARPQVELDPITASRGEAVTQTTDVTTHENASGTLSETATLSTNLHSSGNVGVVRQHVVNDVVVTTMRIENTHCEICNITCNSEDVFKKHKQGKKHSKNVQKLAILSAITTNMPPPVATATSDGHVENKKHTLLQNGASANSLIFCDICNVVCNNQDVFMKHLGGKKHAAKVTGRRDGVSNPSVHPLNDCTQKQPQSVQSVWCEVCKIICNSFEIFNMHISGKKHLKNLKKSGEIPGQSSIPTTKSTKDKSVNSTEGTAVRCELCGISCNTYEVLNTHMTGKKHQKKLEKSQKPIGPNTAPMAEPVTTTPMIGPVQISVKEEGKVVNVQRGKRKASLEDLEMKRRKAMEGGADSGALRTCTVCNVVCTSPTVYITHLAGKKHAAMAVKQAEAGSNGQQT